MAIRVLRKEVSELIAAGEVIERPASVIKELVENSIDAQAKHITVEIKNGGIRFMRITDDGCGIAAEDVKTAFLRHATSKLQEKDDLDKILTLGFRGEALASVAAVARVTVMTRRPEDEMGITYSIAGTEETDPEPTGCPIGTTFMIRDLFFNVPARQKFLKRDVAEANAVSQIVQKIAVSHPDIAFRMIRDNRTEFCTNGTGELYAAVYSVFGSEFAHDMIAVDYEQDGYTVKGYVGKPLYSRASRTFQNFFVNGRYVKSRICSVALENAYQNLIMVGKFPICVLMVQLPPNKMDVNIHPAKAEVRFTDEKAVMDAIFFAVKNALLKNGLIYDFQMERIPKTNWTVGEVPQPFTQAPLPVVESQPQKVQDIPPIAQPTVERKSDFSPQIPPSSQPTVEMPQKHLEESPQVSRDIPPIPSNIPTPQPPVSTFPQKIVETPRNIPESIPQTINIPPKTVESIPVMPQAVPEIPQMVETPKKNTGTVRVLGEVFHNYIVAELVGEDKMLLFDKHAAHERVLFEKFRAGRGREYAQMLLHPGETLLTYEEFTVMQEHQKELEDWGFTPDYSNPPILKTTTMPAFLMDLNIDEIITEIAHNFLLGKADARPEYIDDTLHTMACRSAIKAGDRNTIEDLQALAQEVWDDERIRHCPHGRPVMFVIRKADLEKQFRRT